jgi:hypothetical protein
MHQISAPSSAGGPPASSSRFTQVPVTDKFIERIVGFGGHVFVRAGRSGGGEPGDETLALPNFV